MRAEKSIYFGLLLAALFNLTFAASAAERHFRVAYPAAAISWLPIWAARDVGFFRKYGADIELVAVGSSTRGLAALISDQVDILAGGAPGTVGAYLQGYSDLTLFGNLVRTFVFSVYTTPSITEVQQLRGKRIGVTRFGGTLDFASRLYLKRKGLEPTKDVVLIQIGEVSDIVRALITGAVEAGTIGVPQNFVAKSKGLRELADLSAMGDRYAFIPFTAKKSFLAKNRDFTNNFIKALIEAIHYLRGNPREGTDLLRRYTRIDATDVLRQAYDLYVNNLFSKVPDIQPEDLQLVLEELAGSNPKAKSANARDFIQDRWVNDIVRSNFVDQIYR